MPDPSELAIQQKDIRIGSTYKDIPWPEEERKPLHPDNLQDMTFSLLKYTMSRKEDEPAKG
ncbi:MAG: hypothetical protein IJG40_04675 [Oscillospiraceae bacterium]|nr:hypothetical protein [Oscillospiraceae bacterium]